MQSLRTQHRGLALTTKGSATGVKECLPWGAGDGTRVDMREPRSIGVESWVRDIDAAER